MYIIHTQSSLFLWSHVCLGVQGLSTSCRKCIWECIAAACFMLEYLMYQTESAMLCLLFVSLSPAFPSRVKCLCLSVCTYRFVPRTTYILWYTQPVLRSYLLLIFPLQCNKLLILRHPEHLKSSRDVTCVKATHQVRVTVTRWRHCVTTHNRNMYTRWYTIGSADYLFLIRVYIVCVHPSFGCPIFCSAFGYYISEYLEFLGNVQLAASL